MKKIIQNINGRNTVKVNFRGKKYVLPPKYSLTIEDNEEGMALYKYILSTYPFIIDKTAIFQTEGKQEIVTVKKEFYQRLMRFIDDNAPGNCIKRVTLSDDSVEIYFAKEVSKL